MSLLLFYKDTGPPPEPPPPAEGWSFDPISGSRWSAGGFWAEDGNPQPTDGVWESADDWPKTDDPLRVNAFVEGWPVTPHVQAASWQVGQEDLFAALQVGNASITLRADDALGPLPVTPEPSMRVCILTEATVLWVGIVESEHTRLVVGDPGRTTELSCADDVSKASMADWSRPAAGFPAEVIARFLHASGIIAGVSVVKPMDTSLTTGRIGFGLFEVNPVHTGTTLALIGQVQEAVNAAACWTPAGLRLWKRTFAIPGGALPDALPDGSAVTISRDRTRVINDWAFTWTRDEFAIPPVQRTRIHDDDSIRRHGRRGRSVDASDWWVLQIFSPDPPTSPHPWDPDDPAYLGTWWHDATQALFAPRPTAEVEYPGPEGAFTRLPFDTVEVDGQPYLLTTVRHDIGLDTWHIGATTINVEQP